MCKFLGPFGFPPLAQLAASPGYSGCMFVNIGRSLTLPCRGAPSRDVEWCFQQNEYPDWLDVADLYTGSFFSGNGFKGRVESFHLKNPGNYSLTLRPVVYSDLGIYKCQYRDETEIVLSDVKLEIRVPSNVSVAMGMSASLPCFGKINIQARVVDLDFLWKRGGENVYQLLKNTTTYGPRFENRASVSPEQAVYGNMSLTIRQTRFSDEGDYQCFYNSPKERGNPDSASLVVTGHPPQNLTVKAGGLLSIPLYAADPVRVTFSAGLGSDEVLMLDANKGPARYGERCAQRCELLAHDYTLLLRSVTLEDAGVYKVTDPETNRTIGSVSLEVSGLSAGEVAGIVVGVLVLLLILAGSAFAVWWFFIKNTENSRNLDCFHAARTGQREQCGQREQRELLGQRGQRGQREQSQPATPRSSQPASQPATPRSSQPASQPATPRSSQPASHLQQQAASQPASHPQKQPASQPPPAASQPASHPQQQPSQPAQPPPAAASQPASHPQLQPASQPATPSSSQPASQPPPAAAASQPASQPPPEAVSQPASHRQPASQPPPQQPAQPASHPQKQPASQPATPSSSQPASHPQKQPASQPASHPQQPASHLQQQPASQPATPSSSQPASQPPPEAASQLASQPPPAARSSQPASQPATPSSSQPASHPQKQPASQPASHPQKQPASQPPPAASQPASQPNPIAK
ncbi:uncharacterized protein LOC135247185 isoform X2 [Anguilla rostrata]|uniref:uncharacterized protein LOC135247185 isoform X2 n=1 Tax=Anguilla rostrata TaxID=7938 RepID=UPI0030D2B114